MLLINIEESFNKLRKKGALAHNSNGPVPKLLDHKSVFEQ